MGLALLERVERRATALALLGAVVCLAMLALCCLYQVLSRFVLQDPIAWSEALTRALMIWAVFLALPAAFREGAMVSVNIVPKYFGEANLLVVGLLSGGAILLLAISAWYGFAILPRVRFQSVAGLKISVLWVYLAIPVGMVLSMLAVLTRAIVIVRSKPSRDYSADDR